MIRGILSRLRRGTGTAPSPPAPDAEAGAAAVLSQGNAALARGDRPEAVRCYRAAALMQPQDPLARLNLGYALLESNEPQAALEALQQAIALRRPEHGALPDALFLRGRAQQALGLQAEALASYREALRAQPAFEEPLREAVPMLVAAGRSDEALEWLEAAASSPVSRMLKAQALHGAGRRDEALAVLSDVLAAQPGHEGALESRGTLLLEAGRAQEALSAFEHQLALHGPQPQTVANIAVALMQLGRPHEALQRSEGAAQQHQGHAELQLNRGLAHLLAGEWAAGWQAFEWRWAAWTAADAPWSQRRRWRGEDLAGQSILLFAEQGLGDSIQFLRYVPLVAARAREVLLVLQPALLALASRLPANCRVLTAADAVPQTDWQCPLLGLPLAFGTEPQTVPAAIPYLAADPQRVAQWRARLGTSERPRVGLAWSGNAQHKNDRNRSLPLQQLQSLCALDCQFVSLQPEVRDTDRAAFAAWPGLVDAGVELRDFGDTAALLECIDLVVTVDTGVAHLAGALGRPLWILLPFAPDWRWMVERTDTPWYPGARLYRQPVAGAWDCVVAEVREDLQRLHARPQSPP